MKLGIFGGSFDPPHIAHSIIAEAAHSQFGLDRVLWVPAYAPPHKNSHGLTPYENRMDMVLAATNGHPSFRVSDVERTLIAPTYTIRMLNALHGQYSGAEMFLILGGDSLEEFDTWERPELIIQCTQILVYPRTGGQVDLPDCLGEHVKVINAPVMDLSSEHIRHRILKKESVRYLVRECVWNYIYEHRLYTSDKK